MKWKINTKDVATCPMNNGLTFCPHWRRKIIERDMRLKSEYLRPIRLCKLTLKAIHALCFPHNNKARTGVLPECKQQGNNTPKNKCYQHYCVLFKKAGMPERKYKSNRPEKCFGCRFGQESIKEGLRGKLGNREKAVMPFHKS